jgi:glycosyltransferase involved in cell wall biosynthesis
VFPLRLLYSLVDEPPRDETVTRLLVDARALGDDSAYRGIGTYLRNVLTGIGISAELHTSALVRRGTPLPPGINAVEVRRGAPGRWAAREHELLLPFDLRRVPADVVHSPAQDPPARCPAPWVQTLHDVVPLQSGTPADRRRWRRAAQRIRNASAVIAVSHWSARTGVSTLGLEPSRVRVIPHGVAAHFRPAERRTEESPYLLFVGEYDPRKRHALAFAAVGELAEAGVPRRLVVAGRIAAWYEQQMNELVERSPRPDLIDLAGHVDEPSLIDLYQQAAAVVVTSSAEGFGFPALEAMACGTPVVAFSNSATTEVLGTAGSLVADGDVGGMAQALRRLLTDERHWQDASEAALERARHFSWDECVRQHIEVFTEVAA